MMLWLVGCITLTVEPLPPSTGVEDCPGCADEVPEGDLLLFVNGKLTDDRAGYTTNVVLESGDVLAASVFAYDPSRRGVVAKLGNLDLGPDLLQDGALARTQVRDLAWHPDHGLWAVGIDAVNDEWLLLHAELDADATHQRIPTELFAFRTADEIYWESEVTGLGFDEAGGLWVGSQGTAGSGGNLFASALPTGWSEDPAWPGDELYYSDRTLTEKRATFPEGLGVAGDLADGPLWATVRAERAEAGALDENTLWSGVDAPLGVAVPVLRNHDVEGVAVLDGVAWGIDTDAVVWRLDPARGAAERWDDLSGAFADPVRGVKIRGAARVLR